MQGWLVARAQHNREAWASENIARQGAVPYTPKLVFVGKSGRLDEARIQYLFPSYVFVKPPSDRWRWLLGTYGVRYVLMVGKSPALVQDFEIARIRACEDSEGLVRLPTVRFKPNQKVRVTGGAYTGYEGLYDGQGSKDRERILLDYLGRKTPVLIDPALLAGA